MGVPAGARTNKWNQAVSRIAQNMGWSNPSTDAWLNAVWLTMFQGDETVGEVLANERLREMLIEVALPAPTLPLAFYRWVTS